MSREIDTSITFGALYESPLVTIRDYRCRACRGGPAAEEYSARNDIVFMRHGAFSKHFGRRCVSADVNQVVFFSEGSTYRISHPADCGDRGTVFSPSSRVLNDIRRESDPSFDESTARAFPFVTGPCHSDVFWRHREFVRRLETAPGDSLEPVRAGVLPVEPLWADVTALELIADVFQAAFARLDSVRKRRRQGTDADHVDRVEAAKTYLVGRLGQRVALDDVARAVHASPFHLARVFRERTGVPVHRYLTMLRLRASLERLADDASDLTSLALDLGFSSHGHFADVFRREFGRTPSEVRRRGRPRTLREMSKNLEV